LKSAEIKNNAHGAEVDICVMKWKHD